MPLPVIVGCGGINPAGRVSGHHAYRRMVLDALPASKQDRTYKSLAELMGMGNTTELSADEKRQICDNTLIRRIEHFDPDSVLWQSTLQMQGADEQPQVLLPANVNCLTAFLMTGTLLN